MITPPKITPPLKKELNIWIEKNLCFGLYSLEPILYLLDLYF